MVLWHSHQKQLSGVGGWDFIEILVISLLAATTRHFILQTSSCSALRHMGVLSEYRNSSRVKCRIHWIRSMPIGPVAVEYEWTTEIHLISAAARNVSHTMRSGRQDARTNGLAGGLWENQFSFPCFTGSLGKQGFPWPFRPLSLCGRTRVNPLKGIPLY